MVESNFESSYRMISREDNTLIVEGAVTVQNVVDLMQQGLKLLDSDHLYVDLQKITEVDSTVISMLFEWLRAAEKKNCRLEFIHFPKSLESLIQLYGVTSILQSESNQSNH